jgi:hypothetical protein
MWVVAGGHSDKRMDFVLNSTIGLRFNALAVKSVGSYSAPIHTQSEPKAATRTDRPASQAAKNAHKVGCAVAAQLRTSTARRITPAVTNLLPGRKLS